MLKFILGLIVGGLIVKLLDSRLRGSDTASNPNQEKIEQRQENLEKVLELARQNGGITNDDVEEALGVSDATAERYLQELEKAGKLVQVGGVGRAVRYRLK